MPSPEGQPSAAPNPAAVLSVEQTLPLGLNYADVRRRQNAGELVRRFRGVYSLPTTGVHPDDEAELLLRAAHAHLGPESTLVLGSALRMHGIAGVVGRTIPQLAVPPGLEKHQRPGVQIHVWQIADDQRVYVEGLPVTSIHRTLADTTRHLPRLQAVSCLDSALHLGAVTVDDLQQVRALMRRRRHCVAGRARLAEARIGAQSPLETRVRLRATDGGFPPDALQVPITTANGTVIGYGDIGYHLPNGTWLVVEADGRAVHELPEAILHDRHRQNAFTGQAGAATIRFTWADTLAPHTIPSVLRPALSRAGWRPNPRPRP